MEVTYAPGESSAPHAHPCPVVGYVSEGAIRSRAGDKPETIYKAGDGFYEEANAAHLISANASNKERARFLAFFTCDTEGPLSTPVPDVP
jgi:quercetin dioxygenase-like cupin family protein